MPISNCRFRRANINKVHYPSPDLGLAHHRDAHMEHLAHGTVDYVHGPHRIAPTSSVSTLSICYPTRRFPVWSRKENGTVKSNSL
jgi:hypothetical protein